MKRKIVSTLFALVVCLSLVIPVYADTAEAVVVATPMGESARLVDNSDLLSPGEEAIILEELDEISERYKCDVIIVTSDTLEGMPALDYADYFFDVNGYGYGFKATSDNDFGADRDSDRRNRIDSDGILFLISPTERDWAISISGFAWEAFTDRGQEYIINEVLKYLSDDRYYDAFLEFAGQSDDFLAKASAGKPYDVGNMPKNPSFLVIFIPILLGIIIAFLIVTSMKSKLKSVAKQVKADDYEREGSMNIVNQSDIFLYNQVSRSKRADNNSSGGGGGGTSGGSSGKY